MMIFNAKTPKYTFPQAQVRFFFLPGWHVEKGGFGEIIGRLVGKQSLAFLFPMPGKKIQTKYCLEQPFVFQGCFSISDSLTQRVFSAEKFGCIH